MKKIAFLLILPVLMCTACQKETKEQQMISEEDDIIKGNFPFKNYVKEDIKKISVSMPTKEKITLSESQIVKFIELINDIEIYEEVKPETLAGQLILYDIVMKDDSKIIIENLNPYLIINDIWYKTKYEPCEALTQFAIEIIDEE